MASFNKRPGSALGACLVHLQSLIALEIVGRDGADTCSHAPITGCRLGLVGLAEHLHQLPHLKRFLLADMHLDGLAAKALGAGLAAAPALCQLQLRSCTVPEDFHPTGVAALCGGALASMRKLTDCHLHNNNLRNLGTQLLAASLRHLSALVVLSLPDNAVGAEGAAALAAACPSLGRLQLLNLERNALGDGPLSAFTAGLAALTALRGLNLSDCQLTAAHVPALARPLCQLSTLRWLRLSGTPLHADGAARLAACLLPVTWLEFLALQRCNLGAAGAYALQPLLARQRALQVLDVSGNALGNGGCAAFSVAGSLHELRLAANGLDDGGVPALVSCAAAWPAMQLLLLDGNGCSAGAQLALEAALPAPCTVSILAEATADAGGNTHGGPGAQVGTTRAGQSAHQHSAAQAAPATTARGAQGTFASILRAGATALQRGAGQESALQLRRPRGHSEPPQSGGVPTPGPEGRGFPWARAGGLLQAEVQGQQETAPWLGRLSGQGVDDKENAVVNVAVRAGNPAESVANRAQFKPPTSLAGRTASLLSTRRR